MKTKAVSVVTFVVSFLIFFFCGKLCAPLLGHLFAMFPANVSLAAMATPQEGRILSALPYGGDTPSETIPAKTEAMPLPNALSYTTYPAEPAVISDALQVKNTANYSFDQTALLNAPLSFQKGGPKVLLYHTHTSEAYVPTEKYPYTASDTYRTEDPAYNVCRVGDAIASVLEAHQIGVIHETKSHDYPSYSGCYNRSLETVRSILAENPSIEIAIDLHRDALAAKDGGYMKTAATIDGQSAAQALIIVGTDAGGLSHPDWQSNLSLGLKLQNTLCQMYPGLARPLQLRAERFNGHVLKGALLIEIGACGNTLEEALVCADAVGNALASFIEKNTV